MRKFDCLALDCPLLGPHLIEASAGTGKTFSIEHIFVRLILNKMEAEQILVVTFTRAATRELKSRIRSNLEKAIDYLKREDPKSWPYLVPFFGSKEAIQLLSDALSSFDRAQIFTIHGFCYRMLQEFAFEAKMGFSIPNPDRNQNAEKLKKGLYDFLHVGLNEDLLCPEQCASILQKCNSLEKLEGRLLKKEKGKGDKTFSQLCEEFETAWNGWPGKPIEENKLLEDFQKLEENYRAGKGDLKGQAAALAKGPVEGLRKLIREKGTIFDFLNPQNRKVKVKDLGPLHYPGFFDWARLKLSPFLQKNWIGVLKSAWGPIEEKIEAEEEELGPDAILDRMREAIQLDKFAKRVQQKYLAAIIDEFQDTDEAQWEIFRNLFSHLKAFYLVGDPKQSIYRFRKADIYTYLHARDFLGDENLYHLDTNFRSSKKLIDTLNALFDRDWLRLPKEGRSLPYLPVQAGSSVQSEFADSKGAVHFFSAEEEAFLPFVFSEIEKLLPEVGRLGNFAILVKDRDESERALEYLKNMGVAAVARSRTPLGETLAFQAIRELFEAIAHPRDISATKIVMAGPFGSPTFELPLVSFQILLEEKGLIPFWRKFLETEIEGEIIQKRMISFDLSFYRDAMQIFEELFLWEKEEGFSFKGLKRKLLYFQKLDADEGGGRRMETDPDAVQVMTLHVSKGLEFDLVFALGLASRTPENEDAEESDAEKLRQLYVAMTRAKRRLYVPLPPPKKEAKSGTHSPMELFCGHLDKEGSLVKTLESFSQKVSLTYEQFQIPPLTPFPPKSNPVSSLEIPKVFFEPFYLSSFTSLAKPKDGAKKETEILEGYSLHTMPRGAETGILIHKLFEKLLSTSLRDPAKMEKIVQESLRASPLSLWEKPILEMVHRTLSFPLQAQGEFFSLSSLDPREIQVEMEFVFSESPHFIKGFIDLVFLHQNKIYFLDWKTNWLGNDDAAYTPDLLKLAMSSSDYELQAALYAEAICRHFKGIAFGGAFYFFLRGISPLFLCPNRNLIQECYAR